jgi:hypothetical protein
VILSELLNHIWCIICKYNCVNLVAGPLLVRTVKYAESNKTLRVVFGLFLVNRVPVNIEQVYSLFVSIKLSDVSISFWVIGFWTLVKVGLNFAFLLSDVICILIKLQSTCLFRLGGINCCSLFCQHW